MKDLKIGFIGLGQRGLSLMRDIVMPQEKDILAVCDVFEDRAKEGADVIEKGTGKRPLCTTDYMDVINVKDINLVIIATAWESHVDIAVAAMKAGKAVALEVGGAYSVNDCFRLVRTWEKTRVPFMFLENCCFGRLEMLAMNMKKLGVFGEVVHCAGSYCHDLREEVSGGNEIRHYRLRNYMSRNGENYPTHDLGPIAKLLNINRGNRLVSLVSVSSKAVGLHEYIKEHKADNEELMNAKFQQGDVVTTIIKCANGETIQLTLETTLPRYYSRNFTVMGTKGMLAECNNSIFLDRPEDRADEMRWVSKHANNLDEYYKQYEHPIWKKYYENGVSGSHGGMDWLEFKILFDRLHNDEPMPVDVYDAAVWMAITPLSEESIRKGGAPVEIPDFTGGKWLLCHDNDMFG